LVVCLKWRQRLAGNFSALHSRHKNADAALRRQML
jgi:hypothetical protein